MPPYHSAFFAGVSLLILLLLGVNTSLIRLRTKIYYGDGDLPILRRASRSHGVSVEHLVPQILLLLILELIGVAKPIVDGFGIIILATRFVHVGAFLLGYSRIRMIGAASTYLTELLLAAFVLARVGGLV
jgi:uncharacterized membrane protein YecN with MAPEG domain